MIIRRYVVLCAMMVAIAMLSGCVTPHTQPTNSIPTKESFKSLSVIIEPAQSATYNLSPSPHDNGMYLEGTEVVIDLQVQPGWKVMTWSGPVTKVSKYKTYATIPMHSSQRVSVSLGEVVSEPSKIVYVPQAISGPNPTLIPTPTLVPIPTPVLAPKAIPTPFPITPTLVPTPTPSQEMDGFFNVILYDGIIKKWVSDIKIRIFGKPTSYDLLMLDQVVLDLNDLLSDLSIEIVENGENVELYFVPSSEFHVIHPTISEYHQKVSHWARKSRDYVVHQGKILISSDRLSQMERSNKIREELTQIMGLTGRSHWDVDSVFYPRRWDSNVVTTYTESDRKFIKMLYDPRLVSGMSRRAIEQALADVTLLTPEPVIELDLTDLKKVAMGPQLTRYQSGEANTFFSAGVSDQQVLDMHEQLYKTVRQLKAILGVEVTHYPDLYLLSDGTVFSQIMRFLRVEEGGFDPAGFYVFPCEHNNQDKCHGGIYLNLASASNKAGLNRILAHEYTHSLIDEVTNGRSEVLPTWVNEGLARWSEYEMVPGSDYWIKWQSKLVRDADAAGELIPLSELESAVLWSRRSGDEVNLQYAEAYMALRFLIENYGSEKALELIIDFNNRGSLDLAIQLTTELRYKEFEQEFVEWLKKQ